MSALFNTLKNKGKLSFNGESYCIHDDILINEEFELIRQYKINNMLNENLKFDQFDWLVNDTKIEIDNIRFFSNNDNCRKYNLNHNEFLKVLKKNHLSINTKLFIYKKKERMYYPKNNEVVVNGLLLIIKDSIIIKVENTIKIFKTINTYVE